MLIKWRSSLAAALAAVILAAASVPAQPVLPKDSRDQLEELDQVVLKKQMALFAAKQKGDPQEIEQAKKEFDQIQQQRGKLVRKTRDLY